MAEIESATIRDYKDYSKKSLSEVWKDFKDMIEQIQVEENKRYIEDKALWDKYYKKYNLEYRK